MKRKFQFLFVFITFISSFTLSQVNMEKFRASEDSSGFTGNLDVSATALTGNTDFQVIVGDTRLEYDWGTNYIFFVGNAGYGWESKKAFSDQALAHIRDVQSLNSFLQAEFFLQFNYNKKRLLLSRELAGTGVRFRLVSEKIFKIRLGIAYMYEHERYDLPANTVHSRLTDANRISSYATFKIAIKDGFNFVSVTYYQPKIGEWNDIKAISDNAFVSELSSLIDLTFGVSLRYDSEPPETIKKLDTTTKFGLSFKL